MASACRNCGLKHGNDVVAHWDCENQARIARGQEPLPPETRPSVSGRVPAGKEPQLDAKPLQAVQEDPATRRRSVLADYVRQPVPLPQLPPGARVRIGPNVGTIVAYRGDGIYSVRVLADGSYRTADFPRGQMSAVLSPKEGGGKELPERSSVRKNTPSRVLKKSAVV